MKMIVSVFRIIFIIALSYGDTIKASAKSILSAGVVDSLFGTAGTVSVQLQGTTEDSFYDVLVDYKGRIIASGQTVVGVECKRFTTARFFTDGSLDTTFAANGYLVTDVSVNDNYARALLIDSQNRIIAAGTNRSRTAVIRYLENGSLDSSFGTNGIVLINTENQVFVKSAALDSQGRIVVVGLANTVFPTCFFVARFTSSGALDTTFNGGTGYQIIEVNATENNVAYSVVIDALDKILIAGTTSTFFSIIRLKSDGTMDSSFGGGSGVGIFISAQTFIPYSVVIDQQGKILVGGTNAAGNCVLMRLTSTGDPDTTFGASGGKTTYTFTGLDGYSGCKKITIDPLGRIIMIGGLLNADENGVFIVARTFSNGILDTSFGTNGVGYILPAGVTSDSNGGTIDQQGRILVVGTSNDRFTLSRFTADYSFDYYKAQFATQALGLVG